MAAFHKHNSGECLRHCHKSIQKWIPLESHTYFCYGHVGLQSIGPRATPAVDFKHCSTCAAEKPAVQFWKRRRSIDGLQLVCIQCQKQAAADLRQQRAQWLPFLGATECAYCDELKSLPGFAQRTGTLKGLQYECKQCASRRMSQLYTDNKTKCSVGPETEKVCCRCMLVKSCNEFYRQSNRPDGLQSCCKLCLKQYNYKRYHGHKSLTPW